MKKARLLLLLWSALPLAAQTSSIPCGTNIIGVNLPAIPEISSGDTGVLSGTLYTVSEQVRMPAGNPVRCYPQWVRAYRNEKPKGKDGWNPGSDKISDPMPGPTLRAQVGDVVNLTFLNSIDANKFPNSDQGCDETNVYPDLYGTDINDPKKKVQVGRDTYPDCFAHSVFTNVHFHGTHTSPNTTADNVFITVRPSPRCTRDCSGPDRSPNSPIVTAEAVKENFDAFFKQCNAELKTATGSKVWPLKWSDLYVNNQPSGLQRQLMDYVKNPERSENQEQIEADGWPQHYVGAYPYCFKLPKWTGPSDSLRMGQAPGTHWYHAHKHGSTTINVLNGMTGVFIIEGDYDKALRDYYGESFRKAEKVLVIQQLGTVPPMVTGSLLTGLGGDVNFFVNGKFQPVLEMAGNSVQMWRIANTAGRAGAYFAAPDPNTLQWKQLAIDGVQLAPDNYEQRPSEFLIASGNRIDLLVKAPPFNPGGDNTYPVIVYNTVAPTDRPPIKPTAARLTLFTVKVTANGPSQGFIPKDKLAPLPGFLSDIRDAKPGKPLTFATSQVNPEKQGGATPTKHTIDGKLFDDTVGASVVLNQSEEWTVVNQTYAPAISHPFHIHVNPFQLTEIFDPNAYIPYPEGGTGGGTVSVTEGSKTVVGTAMSDKIRVGDVINFNIKINNINKPQGGVIKAIAGDRKQLTLASAATATGTTNSYSILIPQYTIDTPTRANQCYLDPQRKNTWVSCVNEPSEQRVWWDVFPIPSGRTFTSGTTTRDIPGYFKMVSRFVDYPGHFVLHCHILAHEDRGMMTVVEVTPPRKSPHSHH
ncbi:MAG TPA: multicopper oxidase domain-containing protein [Thermoanaerobaculia bacterium]|nr:multicopper oxidase domain-containing protein [Thermoanaerobaculia bacterium]